MKRRIKRIVSCVLAMALTFGCVGQIPEVRAETTSFTDGDYSYTLSEDDFGNEVATIAGYTGSSEELTIPDELGGYPVVAIGASAFSKVTNLRSVLMQDNIVSVEKEAFRNIKKLTTVVLSSAIKTIDSAAFAGCVSLKQIEIPASLEKTAMVYDYTGPFSDSGLESVTFESGTKKVAERLFRGCKNLVSIELPDSVEVIGAEAFKDAVKLSEVKFPSNLARIEKSAFYGCTSLESIELPDSVTAIENEAFRNATKLNHVKLPSNVKTINSAAFAGCVSLKQIEIPASLEKTAMVYDYTGPFSDSGLESVTFESGTKKVAERLFRGCKNLVSIELPDSVEVIGAEAFKDAVKLSEVKFPSNLARIEKSAFYGCTSLESIELPDSVTAIENEAFRNATKLNHVKLPSNVKTINSAAFAGCVSLKQIEIPASLEKTAMVYDYTGPFSGCDSLKTVTFLGERAEIPESVMKDSAVTWINWPKKVKKIGKNAFRNCQNLDSVTIPDSVTTIDEAAFLGCSNLNSVSLPDSMTTIGRSAFEKCTSLEKMILPTALKEIGTYSFNGCINLRELYAQKKLTSIGKGAFQDTPNLEVYAPEYSDSTVMLIDKDINMAFSDSRHTEAANDIVDWTVTSYDMSDTSASGYVPLVLKYAVKEKYQDTVSDLKLVAGASPVSCINSIKVNGVQAAYTEDKNDHVIVPLNNTTGTVTIYAAPNDYDKIASYVKLKYKRNGTEGSSFLGAVSERTSCLTLGAGDKISYEKGADSVTISVSGYAVKQKDVELYLDDRIVGTVTVSLNGTYKTEISLDSPEDYKSYTIKAVSVNRSGEEVSVEKNVYTVLEAPVLTAADLYIEAHDYKDGSAVFDLLGSEGKIKYITFQPGKKYEFRLNYEHADRLARVFVVSTRGGVRKLLEATWDESTGAYVTHGYFDQDSSYVPGSLSVEYIMKEDKSGGSEEGEITLTNKELSEVPDKWKHASVKENTNTSSDYEAEITLNDGNTITYSYDKMSFTEFADSLRSEYINGSGSSTVAGSFLGTLGKSSGSSSKPPMTESDISDLIDILEATGDEGGSYADLYKAFKSFGFVEYLTGESDLEQDIRTLIRFDYSGDDIVAYMINPKQCDNNILKYTLKKPKDALKKNIIEMMGDKTAGNFLYTMGGNMASFGQTSLNLLWARTEILADPTLTEAQRQAKLAQLDQMRDIACGKLVMQYLSAALMAAGVLSAGTGIGVAAVILSKVIDHCIIPMIESGDFDKFLQGDISLKTLVIRWILDPSGYVYEGVTSNRLSDVKATLYYKETESSAKEILWDAGEYDQENPLYTDQAGCYAWDVPEGWWRVKYEKKGYKTTYSEWMPVPPPQTDVNIAMMPTAPAKVEDIHAYKDYAIISFDQYIDPESVSNIELVDAENNPVAYTISYSKAETDTDGKVYAKIFTLNYKDTAAVRGDSLTVKIPEEVKTPDGRPVQNYESTAETKKTVSMTICNTVHIKQGTSVDLTYTVSGVKKAGVSVTVENPDLVALSDISQDASGTGGTITVTGKVYGITKMRVILEGTGIEKCVDIKVDTYSSMDTIDPPEEPEPEKPEPEEPGPEKPEPEKPEPEEPTADFTYTVNEDHRTVTITKCALTAADITIPDSIDGYTVTSIADYAFEDITTVQTIKFPAALESIGNHAFAGCTALKTISLPKTLLYIGANAFLHTGITDIQYAGTDADWKNIKIDAAGNTDFLTMNVTGSDGKTFVADKDKWTQNPGGDISKDPDEDSPKDPGQDTSKDPVKKPPQNQTKNPPKKQVKKPSVAKVKGFKAKPGNKKLTFSWKKASGVSGYQIQVSTKSSFKNAKIKSISKSKKSYTRKGLKAKKKYYARIRAYKTYKDENRKTKKAYGKWAKLSKRTK